LAVVGDLAGNPITLQNAAEEATLQRAVAALNVIAQKSAGGGIDSRSLSIFQQNLRSASSQASAAGQGLSSVGGAAGVASGALTRAASGFSAAGASVARFSALTKEGTGNLTGSLTAAMEQTQATINRMGGAAGKGGQTILKALSTAAGNIAGVFLQQVDVFQNASRAGADLGGSLTTAHRIAQQAGINLTQFTAAVRAAPEAFAALGAGTEAGGRAFARLNNVVVNQLTGTMARYGVGTEELTARTAEAAAVLVRAGYSAGQLANSSNQVQQIVKQDIAIQRARAKINGTTLEQEREKMKQTRNNMTVEMAVQGKTVEQAEAIRKGFTGLAKYGPAAQQAFLETAKMGYPISEMAATLGVMRPEIGKAIQGMADDINSTPTPDISRFIDPAQRMDPAALAREQAVAADLGFIGQATGQTGAAFQVINQSFMGVRDTLAQFRSEALKNAITDFNNFSTNMKKADIAVAGLAETVRKTQNSLATIATEISESGAPSVLESAAGALATAITGFAGTLTNFQTTIANIIERIRANLAGEEPRIQTGGTRPPVLPQDQGTFTEFLTDVLSRQTGSLGATGRLMEDFGSGTLAMLHGREAVVTEKQMANLMGNLNAYREGIANQVAQVKAAYGTTVSEDTQMMQQVPLSSPSVISLRPEIEEAIMKIAMNTNDTFMATNNYGSITEDLLTDIKMLSR
jgi:hypothetical protein